MTKRERRVQMMKSLMEELENRTEYVPYTYTRSNVSNNDTHELIVGRAGYRKIFATVVVGGIVAHYGVAAIEGVYKAVHIRSRKNNGVLWRFENRMHAAIKEKEHEAAEAQYDREMNDTSMS